MELAEPKKTQQNGMGRTMIAEDDLQRLRRRRYGQRDDKERRYERGIYYFSATRNYK